MKDFYVYGYVRSNGSEHGPAGSFYYIGKGKGHRKYQTKNRNVPVPNNPQNIITFSEGMHESDALQSEMLLIHLFGRIDNCTGCLRNLTDGGDGLSGWVPSDETKAKMSSSRTGMTHTFETKAKIAAARRGKTLTPENKAKLLASRLGKKHSPEVRAKIAEASRRRTHSQETKAKMANARREYYARLREHPAIPSAA
jgi:hypothetical protein